MTPTNRNDVVRPTNQNDFGLISNVSFKIETIFCWFLFDFQKYQQNRSDFVFDFQMCHENQAIFLILNCDPEIETVFGLILDDFAPISFLFIFFFFLFYFYFYVFQESYCY